MLILLPPSETKRPGGCGRPLDLNALALPSLRELRERALDAVARLSADPEEGLQALGLGPRQRGQLAANLLLRRSPALPAIDRYTGVLYDALDAASAEPAARTWLGRHVMIHTAPLGPVGALDRIPEYRLAAGVRLPDLPPARRFWADAVGAALTELAPSFVLDLRSEAYVALGPVPAGIPSVYVRVVATGESGTVRALNHFNKHAKGVFIRLLADRRPAVRSIEGLVRWARGAEIPLEKDPVTGELLLFADRLAARGGSAR